MATPAVAPKSKFRCGIRASFANTFKNCRRKHNIPPKQIATDFALSVASINSWELGERFPTGCNFERSADKTGELPCRRFRRLADKCIPAEWLLAMRKKGASHRHPETGQC